MNLPRVLTAELTYRCNHTCLFCSCPWEADRTIKATELSAGEWVDVFRAVRQRGVEQVTFSGGEATLRDDFFEILDAAKELGFSIGVISNGRRIDRTASSKVPRLVERQRAGDRYVCADDGAGQHRSCARNFRYVP